MTIQGLLFNTDIDQTSLVTVCETSDVSFAEVGATDVDLTAVSSKRGALCGSNLNYIKYVGDVENTISLGTAAAYMARGAFKEGIPYYREYNDVGALTIHPTYHFLVELRRHLAGEATDSVFSIEETAFYNEYIEWVDGAVKTGEILQAVETLDKWLIDEITGTPHPELNRTYGSTHQWVKIGTRE